MARSSHHTAAHPHPPHPRHAPPPHEKKKSMVALTVTVCMIFIVAGWIALLQRTLEKGNASTNEEAQRTSPVRAQIIQTITQLQQDLRALPSPSEIIKNITAPQPAYLTTLAQRIAATATATTTPTSTPPLTPIPTTTNNISP
ncbi:MAG: hypothetical protein WC659_02455 [Patescibacteria group bacterium]